MSRTENHIGTAKLICDEVNGFPSKYDIAVACHGLKPDEDDESQYINDQRFLYLKDSDEMFLIETTEDEYGHCVVTPSHKPSEFNFVLSFYNGAGGFEEVFESALKSMRSVK